MSDYKVGSYAVTQYYAAMVKWYELVDRQYSGTLGKLAVYGGRVDTGVNDGLAVPVLNFEQRVVQYFFEHVLTKQEVEWITDQYTKEPRPRQPQGLTAVYRRIGRAIRTRAVPNNVSRDKI